MHTQSTKVVDGLGSNLDLYSGFYTKLNVWGSLGLNFDYDRGPIIENGGPIFLYKRRILEGILESWVLTHLSTILSLMKYTCKGELSCTLYVTNEHIVHQFMLLFFFCIDHTPDNFKRKHTPAVHTIFLRVI